MLMAPNLRVVQPNNIFRKVPRRRPNAEMRSREYLTPNEVDKLIAAAKLGRHGHRDATLVLVAFRHGLRAVEVADLEWAFLHPTDVQRRIATPSHTVQLCRKAGQRTASIAVSRRS